MACASIITKAVEEDNISSKLLVTGWASLCCFSVARNHDFANYLTTNSELKYTSIIKFPKICFVASLTHYKILLALILEYTSFLTSSKISYFHSLLFAYAPTSTNLLVKSVLSKLSSSSSTSSTILFISKEVSFNYYSFFSF